MKLKFDLDNEHTKRVMQDTVFIDIETSLIGARVWRTGTQYVGAHQLTSSTRLLTVAGGTMYDLYTKGEAGVFNFGNHMVPATFNNDPLDDTFILRRMWDILDKAKIVIAWNARFDMGWLRGRFLELGWPLPSKVSVICPYKALSKYNLTSKKLDQVSQTLIGSKKISTDFQLWVRCSEGDIEAFEEMMRYNIGDIHDTLFKVYLRIAPYIPDHGVDMVDYELEDPQCKVDGTSLEYLDSEWTNRRNGNKYQIYFNAVLGIYYRDRYPLHSPRAGRGFIKQLT